MFSPILGWAVVAAFVLHTGNAWYVVREIAADEKCVNSTMKMAGNVHCPVPDFLVVNSTTNFDGTDKAPLLNRLNSMVSPVARYAIVWQTRSQPIHSTKF